MNRPSPLRETALREAEAMVRHLLATGKKCPPSTVETLESAGRGDPPSLRALLSAHGQLARLVAPATPAAIRLLDEVSEGKGSTLGAVRLVRQMMAVAVASVVVFVVLSLSRHVGDAQVHTSGVWLLLNELFWMASAAIGASFAMLFQVNQYIAERTYDPTHEPTYWIKLVLGVIAGFILVALVPLPEPGQTQAVPGSAADAALTFSKPLVAMLGGFSASAVYGILTRLVEAVEGIFAGSTREQAALRETAAAQRVGGEAAEARIAVAGRLVQVQQALSSGGSPEEVARRLQEVIDVLVSGGEPPQAAAEPDEAEAKVPAYAVVGDAAEVGEEAKG